VHHTSLSSPVAPMERAVAKAWREFSGACARPPRWAKRIGSEDHSAVADTGPVCRSAGPVGHPSTRRLVIMDGGWVLVALGLVMSVVATNHQSALLAREMAATSVSLARLGRLRVAVGDLARSTEGFGVGVARVGRR